MKNPVVYYDCVVYYDKWNWKHEDKKYHRIDGPAVIYNNGIKEWWIHGLRHREDGPAYMDNDGANHYYINGELHRIDGPAIEYIDGTKLYYINGKELTGKEFDAYNFINNI